MLRYKTGQAMADGNKQNCDSHKPCDLNNPARQNPDSQPCVRKCFPLHSFLSQRKTTLPKQGQKQIKPTPVGIECFHFLELAFALDISTVAHRSVCLSPVAGRAHNFALSL